MRKSYICVYLFIIPIFIYATYISHLYFNKKAPSSLGLVLLGAFVLVFIVFCFFRLTGLLRQRRMVRLGYDGEVTVGQELNQLLRDGYYVYHDFSAEKFNIDHIVVGRKGVFAVETKTRSKTNSDQRQKDATVEYNGRILLFPKWTDTETIAQVKRQSSWLSKWLESAIGEPLAVRASSLFPGWYVKRTSPDGIPVVNPKQFTSLFKNIGNEIYRKKQSKGSFTSWNRSAAMWNRHRPLLNRDNPSKCLGYKDRHLAKYTV